MKKLFFFLTAAIAALSLTAAPVDQASAMRKAKSYLANELYAGKVMAPAALNPVLLKAEMGNPKLNQPVYYIYNTSTTFLVIAGDDRAEEILMVGDEPLKDINNLAPAMKGVLSQYKEEITFLQEHPNIQVQKPSQVNTPSLRAVTYGPLLTAKWDQMAPYWSQCVFTYNNRSYQCLTGCPATSASMVLYYWKYPTTQVPAVASYTATLDISYYNSVNFTYPSVSATTFDWANMQDSYISYNSTQSNAVATLMRYVGQLEKMMYGTEDAGGSGIYTTNSQIIATMFKTLGYDSNTRLANKSSYSESSWGALIQGEMAAGRPVVYLGVDTQGGGHAFNVDGYRDSDGKYHVNFGWSGDGNSWYAMNSFTYSGYTFSSSQQAIVGIQPPGGTVTMPQLTVNPTSLSFTGNAGETYTKTFTVTGANLLGDVTLASTNTAFTVSPTTLTAAQAQAGATVTVTYQPTSAGTRSGNITVSSSGATSQTVAVTGTATANPTLTVNPSTLNFSTQAGTPVTKTFTLTAANLTASYVQLAVSGTGFSIDKTTVTKTAATAGVTVTVTYNPSAAGNHTGTVTCTSTGAQNAVVNLTGNATAPARAITVNPTSLTFNNIVGQSATKTFTVTGTNLTGPLTLTLNNAGGVYSITPTTLTAAQAQAGATVSVTYAPTTFGTNNASVTISGGGASAVTVNLTGTASLTKYAPVMQPAAEEYINLTQFRADWTDATPAANVASYTLEVNAKPVEPEVVELIGSINGTSYTNQSYQAVTLSAPWSGNNVYGGYGAIYFRNATHQSATTDGYIKFTIPAGYQNKTFTLKLTTASGQYGSGRFVVGSTQTAAVEYSMSASEAHSWLVTGSTGEVITITSPEDQYSPDIAYIEVYAGDATATLNATETGNETYRLITGITDKFYTVENLTAEGTFLYKVKALYIDGTESDWSNIEEVTLFQNGHGFDLGDVNHDGSVTIKDVTALIDYLLSGGDICSICADVNADGLVSIKDVTDLIDMLLGSGD